MSDSQAMWLRAVQTLLAETFDGPSSDVSFMLNPGDPGLLKQLDSIDAKTASFRGMAGKTTIAGHVDHILFSLTLLKRAADGEENHWTDADWSASWQRTSVDESAWRDLIARLRTAVEKWKHGVATWTHWDDTAVAGIIASVAHTTYHLGAIRQILAAAGCRD